MTVFPSGLATLELVPHAEFESARSIGGQSWDVYAADPFWSGAGRTSKLNAARLQDWEGFVHNAILQRTVIDYVDPIYRHPRAYWTEGVPSVLPGSWTGDAVLVDVTDSYAPVVSGLPVGLVLKRGDRFSVSQSSNDTYHMLSADMTVTSDTAQALPVAPQILVNVFSAGAALAFVDPVVKLMIVPGSFRPQRVANKNTVASLEFVEAPVVN